MLLKPVPSTRFDAVSSAGLSGRMVGTTTTTSTMTMTMTRSSTTSLTQPSYSIPSKTTISTPSSSHPSAEPTSTSTPTPTPTPQKRHHISNLPPEIRLQIYTFCIDPLQPSSPFDAHSKPINTAKHFLSSSTTTNTTSTLPPQPACLFSTSTFSPSLLLLNKTIAREALETIYRNLPFTLLPTPATLPACYYYLSTHPARFAENLTLRFLHDVWTSPSSSSSSSLAALRLSSHQWTNLARALARLPNLRSLTVTISHNSQSQDVDFRSRAAKNGLLELICGLCVLRDHLLRGTFSGEPLAREGMLDDDDDEEEGEEVEVVVREKRPPSFAVVFASPSTDYMCPSQRRRLVAFFKENGLPVANEEEGSGQTCSWVRSCMMDHGAYVWSAAGGMGMDCPGDGVGSDDEVGEDGEKREWA